MPLSTDNDHIQVGIQHANPPSHNQVASIDKGTKSKLKSLSGTLGTSIGVITD